MYICTLFLWHQATERRMRAPDGKRHVYLQLQCYSRVLNHNDLRGNAIALVIDISLVRVVLLAPLPSKIRTKECELKLINSSNLLGGRNTCGDNTRLNYLTCWEMVRDCKNTTSNLKVCYKGCDVTSFFLLHFQTINFCNLL